MKKVMAIMMALVLLLSAGCAAPGKGTGEKAGAFTIRAEAAKLEQGENGEITKVIIPGFDQVIQPLYQYEGKGFTAVYRGEEGLAGQYPIELEEEDGVVSVRCWVLSGAPVSEGFYPSVSGYTVEVAKQNLSVFTLNETKEARIDEEEPERFTASVTLYDEAVEISVPLEAVFGLAGLTEDDIAEDEEWAELVGMEYEFDVTADALLKIGSREYEGQLLWLEEENISWTITSARAEEIITQVLYAVGRSNIVLSMDGFVTHGVDDTAFSGTFSYTEREIEVSDRRTHEEVPDYPKADLDYSYLFTDGGFVEGVKALDYVTVPDIRKLVIAKADLYISDAQVQEYLDTFMQSEYGMVPVDKVIEAGDQVRISYVGRIDGEAFSGGSTGAAGTVVEAGSAAYIDDFLTQIIGHKAGETFDVEVTFPDPYPNNTDYSGKDAVFTTTIMEVLAVPEAFTDEYVLENEEAVESYFRVEGDTTTEFKTAESVRQYIRDIMYERSSANDRIVEILVDMLELEEMPANVTACAKNYLNNMYESQYGLSLDYLVTLGLFTEEHADSMIQDQANYLMLVQAIAESENWTVSDGEIRYLIGPDAEYAEYVAWFGRGYLANFVLSSRFSAFLEENLTITEETPSDILLPEI
ncbi:MAG: FKBP-type peptidyl-prolyl cis-trans isomerase [Lachnospiraceae bacterium]|nr:FKBP-type peptidyl-prolyl cis-trans isomerase [Lachnospiraceae bacterium]